MKQLIAFDLDGTLTESRSPLDSEMAELLCKLLSETNVVVASGASLVQFQKQFLNNLRCDRKSFQNLYLFLTNGGSFYKYENEWINVYTETFSQDEKEKILNAFEKAFQETGITPPKTIHGTLIEDRGCQMTFSGLGQTAPLELKKKWDPDHSKRLVIMQALERHLPEFEISIGGTTSIDVTKKGIDKAYAITQIKKHLRIPKEEILLIGDALFKGGDDYPVKRMGIARILVSGTEETKKIIKKLLQGI